MAETPPRPSEDRSYLPFMAAALAFALGGGLVLSVLISLAPGNADGLPGLVQAHGWAQLQGFAGLFAAGMGMRLLPRLCGRRPLPGWVSLSALVLLASGAALRVVAQALLRSPPDVLEALGGALGGAGMMVVAVAFAATLARSRQRGQGWWLAAWAAAGWWAVWAVITWEAGVLGSEHAGLVPDGFDEPATWVVLLGAIGNLIWTVQARTVPVYFGRRQPSARAVAPPLLLLNLGLAVVLGSAAGSGEPVREVGLAMAGAALLVLAPLCGSVAGRAQRLHASSRREARFVLAANRWAMLAGLLLLLSVGAAAAGWAGAAEGLGDAAFHAVGLGLVTTLIPGVARLLAPVFAIERTVPAGSGVLGLTILVCLQGATALRVAAGLVEALPGDPWRAPLTAVAGCLAWLGLLMFSITFVRAWIRQADLAASLRSRASAR